jgi:cytochrome c
MAGGRESGGRESEKKGGMMRILFSAGFLVGVVAAGAATAETDDEALAFARHMAGECASCHLIGVPQPGIPPIHGLDPARLVDIVAQYRDGTRQHRLMNAIASNYTDEEIATLGEYLADVTGR